MPKKSFVLDDDLAVTIYKRKSSRHLRLSLSPSGEIRVSIPHWAPYRTGLDFARSRQAWIRSQAHKRNVLVNGQMIGKAHRLEFVEKSGITKPTSRLSANIVKVYMPLSSDYRLIEVQKIAEAACVRALRAQAESLLPQRLASLAQIHGYQYGQVSVKRLKGRWGSCDQNCNIVLNLFLMQLPWELIDYVLMHELTHTVILRHGPPFWTAMSDKLPKVSQLRKAIKSYSPIIASGDMTVS